MDCIEPVWLSAKPMSDQQQQAQAFNRALEHFNAGRAAEAERLCREILAASPDHPVVLHLLGVICLQTNRPGDAAELIARSIARQPDMAAAHYNLGLAHQALGAAEAAAESYRRALALQPGNAEAHNNLGNALQNLGRAEEAVGSFQQAIALNPNLAQAHNNLGLALRDLGRLDEALASCRRALALQPDYAEAHGNIGLLLHDLGDGEAAVASYREALARQPGNALLHSNLGSALHRLGATDEAVASYEQALALDGNLAEAHNNLANALHDRGDLDAAISHSRAAFAIEPGNSRYAVNLAAGLRGVTFRAAGADLGGDLLRLFDHPGVPPAYLTGAALSVLRGQPDIAALLAAEGAPDYRAAAEALSAITLLLRLLELCIIADGAFERLLTALRRAMLEAGAAEATPFSMALALNCFINEYAFAESAEESAAADDLAASIAARDEIGGDIPPGQLVALAAYRPLHAFPWAARLAARDWPEDIARLIARQIAEPQAERRLAEEIPAVSEIADDVSQAVRRQYEENPYPRWMKAGLAPQSAGMAAVLGGPPLYFDLAGAAFPDAPEILMAGCGTGQHALYMTSRFRGARTLAVDLSLNSLAYAKRKAAELGFDNIEYVQGDILHLGALDRQFDIIGCAGVLHHMAEPLAGWRVLAGLLRPGGVMKIGLYSEIARRHLAAGRALIAEKGYAATPGDIRRCRQDMLARAAAGDADMARICGGEEFFSLSQCRDLLFHVQEHRLSLPEIEAALEALGLHFLGFEFDDRRTLARFREANPAPAAPASLALWHQFEQDNPRTFSGMYQFWCRKV
jgi:tetratricopeptide (TPR) repeat protein